jgi:hypothetical protein
MPKYFAAGGFIIFFFLASLVQCFAQESFTLNHPSVGTYPNCNVVGGTNCNATQSCVAFTETWTLDRSTIFDNQLVNGTYQNTLFDACPNTAGFIDEWITPESPMDNFAPGFWYGNDGACPNTFPTGPSSTFRSCVADGGPDTVHFQLQLDTAEDFGMSDPQTMR